MIQQLIEIRNNILSALEQNDGILSKMYVNKLDTLIYELSNQQETLEEAAKKHCLINNIPTDQMIVKNDKSCEFETPVTMFIQGAKCQAERMYSEEEVLEILFKSHNAENTSIVANTIKKWFEQFKKK
jgi:hypothetical protein